MPKPQSYYHNKRRFGVQAELVLERDRHCCQQCGMTNEAHIEKWGKRLEIHHKDGEGRNKKEPNNSLFNLITLCRICHGKLNRVLQMSRTTSEERSRRSRLSALKQWARHKYTKGKLIDLIKMRYDELGRFPTYREFKQASSCVRVFGSWLNALEEVGMSKIKE